MKPRPQGLFDSYPQSHYLAVYKSNPMPNKLSRFWQELRRRHVTRVFIWYAGVAMVLIGLASDVAGPFNLPDGTLRLVMILIIIGFPLAMIISWIFDISPEGIHRTRPLENEQNEKKEALSSVIESSCDGSIAVLPFQDMSPEKDQDYFCEGISEEIINALTQVESLKVIARTSAFAFKGKHMDIREIGMTLNVDNILEGSVRKDGNNLRITTQLIRVEDGSHLWSEAFNRELNEVFAIQEEISLAIVEKLKLNLRGKAKGEMLKRHTENPDAYQYYLKGLYYWQMMTPEGNRKAQANYRKAIETDPYYAYVYSILGSNFLFAGMLGFITPELAVSNARENTDKALAIDETISVAHSTKGAIKYLYDWDLEASEKGFLKSVELNPNAGWDRFIYAIYLCATQRYEEAIAETFFALEQDPFNVYITTNAGVILLKAGRTEDAIEKQQWAINIYPNGFMAHMNLGEALEVKGQLDEAISSYEKAISLSNGGPLPSAKLACALHKIGKTEAAQEIVEKIEQMRKAAYIPASILIPYYLLNKDLDRAFHTLKTACDERDLSLPDLMNTPIVEHRIPDDPRFNALLEETGLNKYMA